jgi:hypothetical protein
MGETETWRKMCPKVILEGTRLTFKTEIAFQLNEHPRVVGPRKYRYHSPIISAEWGSFTNFPWGRGLINFEPYEEAKAMETYKTWGRLLELQKYYSWIVDRFHISTQAYQFETYERQYDFGWLEARLKAIGFQLIYLHRSPASFAEARERRLKASGNPSQYDDLSQFVEEQALMDQLVDASILPTLRLDISDNDVERATETIADYLHASGAIWADY